MDFNVIPWLFFGLGTACAVALVSATKCSMCKRDLLNLGS